MKVRRRLLAALLVGAIGMGACGAPEGLPVLSDPHEIVTAAGAATAALQTVHARIDIGARNGGAGGAGDLIKIQVEADIDVQGRNLAGRTQMTQGDPPVNAPETSEFILLDRILFGREGVAAQWFANNGPDNGGHLPTNPDYLGLIERAIGTGSADVALAGNEACGEGTCYHLTAALDEDAAWLLIVAPLIGSRSDPLAAVQPDVQPSPATLDLYVDQSTRLLVGFTGTFGLGPGPGQTTVGISVTFTNHNVPIRIAAPPAQLIRDELDNVGEPIPPPTSAIESPP